MSIDSWLATYYPKEAHTITNQEEALIHSIKKWEGLSAPNLAKHGLLYQHPNIVDKETEMNVFRVGSSNCALCQQTLNDQGDVRCVKCPISLHKALSWASCSAEWNAAERTIIPMINLLKATYETVIGREYDGQATQVPNSSESKD